MRKSPTKYTKKDFARMKRLLDRGYTYHGVHLKLGVPWRTVVYHFKPGEKAKANKASKKWRKLNPDKAREYARMYSVRNRKLNPQKVRLKYRKYYDENKDKCKSYSARYRKNHPEKILEWRLKEKERNRAKRLRVRAFVEYYKDILKQKNADTLHRHQEANVR